MAGMSLRCNDLEGWSGQRNRLLPFPRPGGSFSGVPRDRPSVSPAEQRYLLRIARRHGYASLAQFIRAAALARARYLETQTQRRAPTEADARRANKEDAAAAKRPHPKPTAPPRRRQVHGAPIPKEE